MRDDKNSIKNAAKKNNNVDDKMSFMDINEKGKQKNKKGSSLAAFFAFIAILLSLASAALVGYTLRLYTNEKNNNIDIIKRLATLEAQQNNSQIENAIDKDTVTTIIDDKIAAIKMPIVLDEITIIDMIKKEIAKIEIPIPLNNEEIAAITVKIIDGKLDDKLTALQGELAQQEIENKQDNAREMQLYVTKEINNVLENLPQIPDEQQLNSSIVDNIRKQLSILALQGGKDSESAWAEKAKQINEKLTAQTQNINEKLQQQTQNISDKIAQQLQVVNEYSEQLAQKATQFEEHLQQQLKVFRADIDGYIESSKEDFVLPDITFDRSTIILLIEMAKVAAENGQYENSIAHLTQIQHFLNIAKIDNQQIKEFNEALEKIKQKVIELSAVPSNMQYIDELIAQAPDWQLLTVERSDVLQLTTNDEELTIGNKIKNIAKEILNNTVAITKKDTAGIAWINSNAQLQAIIRQNIILELSYARNLLQLKNYTAYHDSVNRIIENINNYFNVKDEKVAIALQKLSQIKQPMQNLPNFDELATIYTKL